MLVVKTRSGSTYEISDDQKTVRRVGRGAEFYDLAFDYAGTQLAESLDIAVGHRMIIGDITTTPVVSVDLA